MHFTSKRAHVPSSRRRHCLRACRHTHLAGAWGTAAGHARGGGRRVVCEHVLRCAAVAGCTHGMACIGQMHHDMVGGKHDDSKKENVPFLTEHHTFHPKIKQPPDFNKLHNQFQAHARLHASTLCACFIRATCTLRNPADHCRASSRSGSSPCPSQAATSSLAPHCPALPTLKTLGTQYQFVALTLTRTFARLALRRGCPVLSVTRHRTRRFARRQGKPV